MTCKAAVWFVLTLIVFFSCKVPIAAAMDNAVDAASELAELLSVLDEETSIATKTRLNSDFVPGMVTVLNGADMEALGMPTAFAALATVPGVQTMRLPQGEPLLIMRGLQFPFNTGNVKVMVNSLAMSGEASGLNSSVLFIPIQQIDRIEIVRGPGSAIYGDYAFMGLVNIITKTEEDQIFALADNDHNGTVGLQLGYQPVDRKFSWSVNLAGFDSGKNTLPQKAPDGLPEPRLNPDGDDDRRPPSTDNGMSPPNSGPPPDFRPPPRVTGDIVQKRRFANLQATYDNTQIRGQYFQSNTSGHENLEKSRALGIHQSMDLSSSLTADAGLAYLNNSFYNNSNVYEGSVIQGDLKFNWLPNTQHNLLVSLNTERTSIDLGKSRTFLAQNNPSNVSDHSFSGVSIGVQDQIAVTEGFNLIAGLQYYRRSDSDRDLFSPRLAAVWQAAENHILKTQYAQGFRSATFFESFIDEDFNNNLDFEINKTSEISYIYRTLLTTVRVTGFLSEIENMIYRAPPGEAGFNNDSEAKMYGGELEWEHQLYSSLTLKGNVSYVDAEDNRNVQRQPKPSIGSAHWLSNFSLVFKPLENSAVGIHWNRVGDRALGQGEIDGYDLLDISYSRFNFLAKGFNLSGGIRNLLDDDVIYFHSIQIGEIFRQYPGRTVWIQGDYVL